MSMNSEEFPLATEEEIWCSKDKDLAWKMQGSSSVVVY